MSKDIAGFSGYSVGSQLNVYVPLTARSFPLALDVWSRWNGILTAVEIFDIWVENVEAIFPVASAGKIPLPFPHPLGNFVRSVIYRIDL